MNTITEGLFKINSELDKIQLKYHIMEIEDIRKIISALVVENMR